MSKSTKSQTLHGFAASPGLAHGSAFVWQEAEIVIPHFSATDVSAELARLTVARSAARQEIEQIVSDTSAILGKDEIAIFEAHLLFLDDATLLKRVETAIQQGVNVESAWADGIAHFAAQLQAIPDPTLSARAADVRDVGQRVIRKMLGVEESPVRSLTHPAVIVARDLTPSQTASLKRDLVLGFCTVEGGLTSHTAILARALGVPAVVGLGEPVLTITAGTPLLMNGRSGKVTIHPSEKSIRIASQEEQKAARQSQTEHEAAAAPAVTRDGHLVKVAANVGGLEEARQAVRSGAEGIGLLRTEFLYLDRNTAPDETEQMQAYTAILEAMGNRPVVARTLDVGGDKMLPYLHLDREANPFLGCRGIRLCLERPALFKTQLRALLRAGVGHSLLIMFPMIATLEEIQRARALLEEARNEAQQAGNVVADTLRIGMMVEVPSVVVLAEQFARHVDFFSIGTNDLTQYTMAAERTNARVAYLGDACHPAVLRQIQRVVETGHAAGIWVGVCGELAADPEAIPLLLGLGVDELSMTPNAIPQAKAIIRRWTFTEAQSIASQALAMGSAADVRAMMKT